MEFEVSLTIGTNSQVSELEEKNIPVISRCSDICWIGVQLSLDNRQDSES
jgi:hypothetical protein